VTWTSSSDSDQTAATTSPPATVGALIREGTDSLRQSGSETARLDAELLLGHVVRADRATLIAMPDAPVGADHVAQFRTLIDRRATGEPVAYIRGIKEFYGLALAVDPRALIPRPETELLVELGLDRLRRLLTEQVRPPNGEPLLVWDVGTGSGAICVALAVESRRRGYAPDVRFRASDVSADALALATENAVFHGVADIIDFAVADLAEEAAFELRAKTDLLLANLPYVPTATVPTLAVAASFEPVLALDGGPDGLDLVRRLMGQVGGVLAADGVALLEIGSSQGEEVKNAAASAVPGWVATIHNDLAGLPRVAEISPRPDA
jgi:release factor glutamine methyltransferase